jgi:hypothetical protein
MISSTLPKGAKMTQNVSINTATTAVSIDTATTAKAGSQGVPLWPLILIAFVGLILSLDASLTPDQRLEVFLQSGMYP